MRKKTLLRLLLLSVQRIGLNIGLFIFFLQHWEHKKYVVLCHYEKY